MDTSMKERNSVILSARVSKVLMPKINEAVKKSRKPSRNAWVIWAIEIALRSHKKDDKS